MKKLLFIMTMFLGYVNNINAQANLRFNYNGDENTNVFQPTQNISPIDNSRIVVNYEGAWPYYAQGAFEYACKLFEVEIPGTYPITINAVWDTETNSLPSNILSSAISYKSNDPNDKQLRTCIKGCNYIPTIYSNCRPRTSSIISEYFETPDIELRYYNHNNYIINNCTFSIDNYCEINKYDFVTIVLRDLYKSFGVDCRFNINEQTNKFNTEYDDLTYFEGLIRDVVYNRSESTLFNEIILDDMIDGASPNNYDESSYTGVSVYNPTPWDASQSLNYFVNTDDNKVSSIMRYNFGRNCLLRNVTNSNALFFKNILGWYALITDNTTSSKIITRSRMTNSINIDNIVPCKVINYQNNEPVNKVKGYYDDEFGEYLFPKYSDNENRFLLVLMKDGTYDLIDNDHPESICINNYQLQFPIESYARDNNGDLRLFSVIDTLRNRYIRPLNISYLPQKIDLKIEKHSGIFRNNHLDHWKNTIGIKNLEGTDRVVATTRPSNSSVETNFEVEDFKKGFFVLNTPERGTIYLTLTAYNENGSTQSETIEIHGTMGPDTGTIGDIIIYPGFVGVNNTDDGSEIGISNYSITALNTSDNANQTQNTQIVGNTIDITALNKGYYIINLTTEFGETLSKQFYKKD